MKNLILIISALFFIVNAQSQTLEEVITDFVEDGGNAYQNAAMQHTRDGSGHFEDIEYFSDEFSYYNNATAYQINIVMSSSEDWEATYNETEKILNKLPLIKKEKWIISDKKEGIGKRYYYEKDINHTKLIELFYGDNHTGEKKIVGINIEIICMTCYGGDLELHNIPKGKGYSTNILSVLQTEEGKKAFQELLAAADNDFEDIIDFDSKKGNVYQVKESLLNPKAEIPFIEIHDFEERRELHLTPHREKGEYGPIDVIILFDEHGYGDLFDESDWVRDGGDSFSYNGKNTKSHLMIYRMLEMETGYDYDYDYLIIESVKKSSREANGNNTLIPSDLHPKAAEMLGCKSGDCKNGFGKLVYLNPAFKGEIYGYIGHFKNGVFEGSGVHYDYVDVSTVVEFDTLVPDYEYPELEETTPNFIGYFVGGKAVMIHKYLGWSEMGLCESRNRVDDCKKWRWTIDQYNYKDHRFSVYTFATRGAGTYQYDYDFLQHQTFDNGKTVRFDKPLQADFGKCISGKCKDGFGILQLKGIGKLEANFDEEGIAANESVLTLLSGEVYDVKSIKGVPTSFRRISVPAGLSWKKMARCGAWIMLQENTCLEGDCRNGYGVESFVKNKDGSPKTIPGYFIYQNGLSTDNNMKGKFVAYHHTGVENERFHRENNPDYDFSFTYDDYYDIQLNEDYLYLEKEFVGEFSDEPILKGKYQTSWDKYTQVRYYKNDIHYDEDMKTTYKEAQRLLAEKREKEFDDMIEAFRSEKKRQIEEQQAKVLALQQQEERKRQAAATSNSSSGSSAFSTWLKNSTDVDAMNSIFARPSNETSIEEEYGITDRCSRCMGTGVCYEKRKKWTKVREESMLFYSYTYKDVEYEEAVTCPVCRGTGKK